MPITILLADDHDIVRAGIRSVLEKQPDMRVVAEAQDGRDAVRLAIELVPHVVLMDLTMPGLNGFEATRKIKGADPQIQVAALSMHSDLQFIAGAIKAGASGYLLKNSASMELPAAVRALVEGATYFSAQVDAVLLEEYLRHATQGSAPSVVEMLTGREREVLQLLAEGKISKQIAAVLGVTQKTVEAYRGQIMDKLGLRSVAELTKLAVRAGLTPLDS